MQQELEQELTLPAAGRMTVGEAAETIYPGQCFDTALPQDWVNRMYERGFDVRGHFVTLYPRNRSAYIAPITPEGVRMAAIVATCLG